MRPVRVTSPAPMMTPRIPNKGLVETSEGIAAAASSACWAGVGGRVTTVEAAILMPRTDSSGDRKARAQLAGQVGIVECNFYRDSLHDLGEIASRVVGRQQRKLRSASRRNLDDFATDDLSGVCVDTDLCRITDFDIGQLGLAVIRL